MNDTPKPPAAKSNTFIRIAIPVLIMAALSVIAILYGHRIYDFFAAKAFTPSAEIAQIHDDLNLTSEGSNILYASQPKIEAGAAFNQSCMSSERTAAILGCYYMRRVYVYDVTNKELEGAEEVTMAHEMLHAAYERLNYLDRHEVDKLLQEEYAKKKDEPRLKDLMAYYERTEPEALINELHSILGTVVSDLSPQLESYYARYFNDRQHVVKVNNTYYAVFAEVESRAKALSEKTTALSAEIARDKDSYMAELERLKADIDGFKQRATTGYYTSNSALQAATRGLNARVSALEANRLAINAKVDDLNRLIEEQNALNVRAKELNSNINGISNDGVSL